MRRLSFLILLLLAQYTLIAWWFPLLPHVDRLPLADIRTFAPTLMHGLAYAILICALFGLYWLAYRWVQTCRHPPRAGFICLVGLLFGLPLLVTYPINAVDVYRYFFEGRMLIEHGVNPLATPPNALADDPYLPYAAILLDKTSPYGPLWELLGGLLYLLSRGNLLAGLLLFKAAGLAFHLAAGLLIWQLLADQEPRVRAARLLLWTWNPALLLMFVTDAHNDILMLLFLLLGYKFMRQGQPSWGLILMAVAPLVKPIAILPLPIFAIMAWRALEGREQRMRGALLAALGIVVITVLAFLPFGSPLPLLARLIDESRSGASYSPFAFLIWLAPKLGLVAPFELLASATSRLLGLVALLLLWWTWRGRSPLRGVADLLGAYLLTALRFRIWYPTWLFPWLILDVSSHFRLYTGLWLLLTSQLSVVIYGHIRVAWLGDDLAAAHLVAVPFVFGLPPLLALLMSWNRHQKARQRTQPEAEQLA